MDDTPSQAPANPAENTEPAAPEQPKAPEQGKKEAPATQEGLGLTPEQEKEFKNFIGNSGGFDAAFSKLKSAISNPQKVAQESTQQAQTEPQPASQPQPQPQPQEQAAPQKQVLKGGMTYDEFITMQYFDRLAGEEQFKPIADQIRSGDVLKEMNKFGIKPTVDGQFNDAQVRDFLGLVAKTVPTKQTQVEPTTTPTVDYVEVGEQVNSIADVNKIIAQNAELRARGLAEHPKTAEAKKFMAQHLKNQR